MRKNLWILVVVTMLLALSTTVALATTPTGFCNGTEGWQIDLNNNPAPPNPECGPGSFNVDVTGGIDGPFGSFDDALDNLRGRGGVGTLWFKPDPQPTYAPEGFCVGAVGWVINLETDFPQTPNCGPGTYTVSYDGTVSHHIGSFEGAVMYIHDVGDQGTLWFHPEPQPTYAPEGFCEGNVGWPINLVTDMPEDPVCGSGDFFVDVVNTLNGPFSTFMDAIDNLQSRGGNGALWFDPALDPVPTPDPVPTFAPANFCQGTVGWPINLATDIPQDPSCGEGYYVVDLGASITDTVAFDSAVQILVADDGEGAFWFVPRTNWSVYMPLIVTAKITVSAPSGFCDGTVGWAINLNTQDPQRPGCDGKMRVEVNGDQQDTASFDSALDNLSNRGGEGTIWYQK